MWIFTFHSCLIDKANTEISYLMKQFYFPFLKPKNVFSCLGLIFLLLYNVVNLNAQCTIEIKVNTIKTDLEHSSNVLEGKLENHFRFFLSSNSPQIFPEKEIANPCFYRHDDEGTYPGSWWGRPDYMTQYFTFFPDNVTLKMRAWDGNKENGSMNCTDEDGGPVVQALRTVLINNDCLGKYSQNYDIVAGWNASANFKVKVYFPQPYGPTLINPNNNPQNICANSTVTLGSGINWPNLTGLQFEWEYHVAGETKWIDNPQYQTYVNCINDCDLLNDPNAWLLCSQNCQNLQIPPFLEVDDWKTLPLTNTPEISFNPNNLVNGGLQKNTNIEFRVRVKNGTAYSNYSTVKSFSFSPSAPTSNNITTSISCPNTPNGTININNIAGIGDYKYILRKGFNNNKPCDINNVDNNCLDVEKWGKFQANNYTITNVPLGQYTLWLTNPGADKGVCYSTYNVQVQSYEILKISLSDKKDISCQGAADGQIKVTYTGGNPNNINYTLEKGGIVIANNNTGIFDNLLAGNYTVKVTDACNQLDQILVSISEPTQVQGQIITKNALCTNPANGALQADVQNGSGKYNFKLLLNNNVVASLNNALNNQWVLNTLAAGTYQLQVRDADRPGCPGYDTEFTITAPPALSVSIDQNKPVSCFGGNDGALTVKGTGGTNQYKYALKNILTNQLLTNAVGIFNNLSAGSYEVTVQSAEPGCNDSYTYPNPLLIAQPNDIAIDLLPKNVSCHGLDNGSVEANVQGGNGNNTYQWQILLNGAWTDYNLNGQGNGIKIENLFPGSYRLLVKDGKSCEKISLPAVITEPDPLVITNVQVNDIKCFGETGSIQMSVQGGNGGYIYEYSNDNGNSYNVFDNNTPLNAGSYLLKVKDSKGCNVSYNNNVLITAPPQPLDFTYTLSNHNGFNISCFGANDGTIQITPSGGNGSNYTGYTYAMDNDTYTSNNTITNISAGLHSIKVKDARGCIVSKNIQFTQPQQALNLSVITIQHNECSDGQQGSVEVKGAGGTQPYQYALNNGLWQNTGLFNQLPTGAYTVKVRDVNGCSSSIPVSINSLNAAIEVASQTTSVKCFGGNDGSIQTNVAGGVPPYSYQWLPGNANTPNLSNLTAGDYTLTVKDNKGCEKKTVITVTQPAASLTATIAAKPVCYGSTKGEIKISAQGGTNPYAYSIDNGINFQPSNEFKELALGNYQIVVKDSKDCIFKSSTTIVQKNDQPKPNFLVSSRQNALDTLIAKEICIPKPDSVKWVFDPATVVIDPNPWSPKIRFDNPGTYKVSMTGYFGGCDYTITKDLQIKPFDPNAINNNYTLQGIEKITVSPNPNGGTFNVQISLYRKQRLRLTVFDIYGKEYYQQKWESEKDIIEQINLGNAPSGSYILRAITENDSRDIIIIVNK